MKKIHVLDRDGIHHEFYIDAITRVIRYADCVYVTITNQVDYTCSGQRCTPPKQLWTTTLDICKQNDIKVSTPSYDDLSIRV